MYKLFVGMIPGSAARGRSVNGSDECEKSGNDDSSDFRVCMC